MQLFLLLVFFRLSFSSDLIDNDNFQNVFEYKRAMLIQDATNEANKSKNLGKKQKKENEHKAVFVDNEIIIVAKASGNSRLESLAKKIALSNCRQNLINQFALSSFNKQNN